MVFVTFENPENNLKKPAKNPKIPQKLSKSLEKTLLQ
jgi:hypothetical protein